MTGADASADGAAAIVVSELSKRYGERTVVDGLSLTVREVSW